MENELVHNIKDMEGMLFGFTPKCLQKLAYQLAKANNIHQRVNDENEEADMEWYLVLCLETHICH